MDTQTPKGLINDSQSLESAAIVSYPGAEPIPIQVYDDGDGKLFIHRNSLGITGIVRARTWEDAYEICEDEFFPDADETEEELIKEFGENYHDDACFQEQYGYRNNTNERGNCMYSKDLNGDWLDTLTSALAERLNIVLVVKDEE